MTARKIFFTCFVMMPIYIFSGCNLLNISDEGENGGIKPVLVGSSTLDSVTTISFLCPTSPECYPDQTLGDWVVPIDRPFWGKDGALYQPLAVRDGVHILQIGYLKLEDDSVETVIGLYTGGAGLPYQDFLIIDDQLIFSHFLNDGLQIMSPDGESRKIGIPNQDNSEDLRLFSVDEEHFAVVSNKLTIDSDVISLRYYLVNIQDDSISETKIRITDLDNMNFDYIQVLGVDLDKDTFFLANMDDSNFEIDRIGVGASRSGVIKSATLPVIIDKRYLDVYKQFLFQDKLPDEPDQPNYGQTGYWYNMADFSSVEAWQTLAEDSSVVRIAPYGTDFLLLTDRW